jgi:hypothetical protein
MPIEAISPEQYKSIITNLASISDSNQNNLKIDFHDIPSKDISDPDIERYCDSDICVLDPVN